MTHTAYLSLGSNVGSRAANLHRALELLKNESIVIDALSSIYETEPWGVPDQPMFLNMVARLKTTLNPKELLRVLLAVEKQMGRERLLRWGPRIIDLDILLYDNEVIHDRELEIPHPRMVERAFVLVPLLEVNPDVTLPDGTPLKKFLSKTDVGTQFVNLYTQ
ncbi:MAG TPA: 2-amino-4-hydroxy-6-hydroxymethyldihydropteridine diphosphokinase [Clostridia bacterium]|jgi:2-amino-4-hydroxy-6-hydroxymethyldihydropteridine diphosphokinase|nr:2-amino-4-hydroxy-6-hydroxymethyldihydropteridine diphosphokinase [Clostridia bacterium]